MNAAQYARAKELFAKAILQPEDERERWVKQQCGADERIAGEVLSLLRHHSDETVLEVPTDLSSTKAILVKPSQEVDPYLVLSDVWKDNRQLLRRRLMVIACVMAVLVGISLVRLFTYQHAAVGYGARIASLTINLGCAWLLFRHPNRSLFQLRIAELVVMGNVGLLAVVLYVRVMFDAVSREDYVTAISINNWNYFIWAQLIFVYGVFMPNTWQRAAAVLVPVVAIPSLSLVYVVWKYPAVSEMLKLDEYGHPFPAPLIAACVAIYAAHLIHGARLSAFGAQRLAQYRLKRLIGEGGMGQVFEAEHLLLKRPCAIKIIQPDRCEDDDALRSFEVEVQATAKLTHPHTVDIYDYGQTREGRFFCAMELLPGMNLRDLVEGYGPLPPARAIRFLSDVCEALQEAHDAGLIHRDIKPANIFASQRGGINDYTKLLDFGLVGRIQVDQSQPASSGMIAGTPNYMSPEQVTTPTKLDARTDIYSLGAVAYFLVTGRPPLAGRSPIETMLAHVNEQPVPPSQHQEGIPADLEQVIMRCLVKEVDKRTASAEQLRSQLQECQAAGRWTASQAKQWWANQRYKDPPKLANEPR